MTAESTTTAPAIKIVKVKRSTKKILVEFLKGDDEGSVNSPDNPLPEFFPALDALAPLVTFLCDLPAEYEEGLTVTGLRFTKSGNADAVLLIAKKKINGNTRPFNIITPLVLMDQPEEGEAAHLTTEQAILVERVVEEAIKYASGMRSQGHIKLEPDAAGDDGEGEGDAGNG